ncbi:DEKNAAC104741 [Brettanomyces naardenensis]|uniref:DEKNAAC104741 n=1 Tax=Brettanomyces naardenensis TaxID=13370 RepID=A0A448YRN5_BRENA|nr:DEKNAAC104741 [Brettanomyces naardenensis]
MLRCIVPIPRKIGTTHLVRYLSISKTEGPPSAEKWIANFHPDRNLLKHFDVSYAHSSGKGGQHVNTTDSKAQIKMPAALWFKSRGEWISEIVFDELMNNYNDRDSPAIKRFPYFTSHGDVLVESQKTRYRDLNLQDCLNKFVLAVKQCGQPKQEIDKETEKTWQRYRKRDNEQRLHKKKQQKVKKQFRGHIKLDDM